MESLKIGRSTFYKLIHKGKLKGYKDGNKFKMLSTSVNDYVADKMKTSFFDEKQGAVLLHSVFSVRILLLTLKFDFSCTFSRLYSKKY